MELFKSRTRVAYTNAVGDKVYPVVVDIKKGIKSTEDIQFVSSDVNTGILSVAFISGNENFNVSGADVVCSVMRPDASTLELPCEVVRENIVEVPLGINGTSQDGVYSFDFKVLKGGNRVVGTPIMNYSVSLSIGNDMVVEEDDRLPVLTMLITQVNELKEETSDIINQANTATEASKVATANAIEATNNANAVSERVSQETATAISEIKQDTENAIASMNQNTSSAISTMNQSATDAISSMEQSATNAIANMTQKTNEAVTTVNENLANINNVVTTKVAELDNAKSDMTNTVSNKVNEVETRFNALASSQQQDAEVIDARDGEASLKARLDRDIEKTNKELDKIKKLEESTVSTVTTESDFTTVEATSNGYFEDVKLEGKTLVNVRSSNPYDYVFNNDNNIDDKGIITINANGSYSNAFDKLPSRLKPNTEYTIVLDIISNTLEYIQGGFVVVSFNNDSVFTQSYAIDSNASVGKYVFKRTTKSDFANITYMCRSFINYKVTSGEIKFRISILEGDHTQNPPNGYIEGLKSVGQSTSEDGVDEIVVSSVKFNTNMLNPNDFSSIEMLDNGTFKVVGVYSEGKVVEYQLKPNCVYNLKWTRIDGSTKWLKTTVNGEVLSGGNGDFIFTTDCTGKILFNCGYNSSNDKDMLIKDFCIIEKGGNYATYTPHQSDKKRLLYYNEETQTWEKPILREWDSIEKHANGKYYYHQRSGEGVFDGSEDEKWWDTSEYGSERENTLEFRGHANNILRNLEKNNLVCDKFNFVANIWNKDAEGIGCVENNSIDIRIPKSKLSTQNTAGFKQWLQANNVTVVYQLAQEKVYECTNIDLITYANETNYVVESGAITPKSILKVHNNISNVVKILQEKVSLLENKFIEGLKKVLAGDMYSLAELLYPEDFVEEDSENKIMLLPFE